MTVYHAIHKDPEKPRSVADVIEDLGFGWAQIQWTCFAYGVWLSGAFSIGLGCLVTVFLSNELHFSATQRASIATIGSAGLVMGSGCGGALADYIGRRRPLLLCLLLTSCVAVITPMFTNFWWLACMSFCSSFAISIGFPASLSIVSETLPQKYRVGVQASRSIFFNSGLLIANVVLIFDDPYYKNMHWRQIFMLGSLPTFIMFAVFFRYLRESPVFLAKTGCHEQAIDLLQDVKDINNKPGVNISYAKETEALTSDHLQSAETPGLTLASRCTVIFGQQMVGTTITLLVTAFSLNCILYGHMYAFPLISTNIVHSTIAPAYQSLIQGLIGMVVILISLPLSVTISRRSLLALGLLLGVAGMCLFAWTGSLQNRQGYQNYLYFAAQNAPGACATFSFIIIYQLAVDVYPVQVASTAAGLVLMVGKTGALVAPFLFTVFNDWWNFYYMLAQMAALSLLMCMTLLRFTPWDEEQAAEQADEDKPLLHKVV